MITISLTLTDDDTDDDTGSDSGSTATTVYNLASLASITGPVTVRPPLGSGC